VRSPLSSPVSAGEWVIASTSSGKASIETCVPTEDTNCPHQSNTKSWLRQMEEGC